MKLAVHGVSMYSYSVESVDTVAKLRYFLGVLLHNKISLFLLLLSRLEKYNLFLEKQGQNKLLCI